jgi:hypothetical protein
MNSPEALRKMPNVIVSLWGNANQNQKKLSLHTTRTATVRNIDNNKCWQGCGRVGTLLDSWWEYKTSTAALENSLSVSPKVKHSYHTT